MKYFGEKLYRSHGVLWGTTFDVDGYGRSEFVVDTPLCANTTCHMVLQITKDGYFCTKCPKVYSRSKSHKKTVEEVRYSWEGFQTLEHPVYSLDLPPTKVVDEDKEDENYWVQARISEKDGKRMAIVYFGERVKGKQEKMDYSQIFLDFEDEQLRFDKTNKNPMKLLAKLTAKFPESEVRIKRK